MLYRCYRYGPLPMRRLGTNCTIDCLYRAPGCVIDKSARDSTSMGGYSGIFVVPSSSASLLPYMSAVQSFLRSSYQFSADGDVP